MTFRRQLTLCAIAAVWFLPLLWAPAGTLMRRRSYKPQQQSSEAEGPSAISGRSTRVISQSTSLLDEPNASAESSGVHLLDDYLRATYETDHRVGGYVFLRRMGRP
jgi:hypothetical protein